MSIYGDAAIDYLKHNNDGKNLDSWLSTGCSATMLKIYRISILLGAKPLDGNQPECFFVLKRVLNGLQRDTRFEMQYIIFPGVISRPSKCFHLKKEFQQKIGEDNDG